MAIVQIIGILFRLWAGDVVCVSWLCESAMVITGGFVSQLCVIRTVKYVCNGTLP